MADNITAEALVAKLRSAHALDGRHFREIAAASGVNYNTVYKLLAPGQPVRPMKEFRNLMTLAEELGVKVTVR